MSAPVSLQHLGIHVIRRLELAQAVGLAGRPRCRMHTAEIDLTFVPLDDTCVIASVCLSKEPIAPEEAIRRLAAFTDLVRVDLAALRACPPETVGTFTLRLRFDPDTN